MKSNIDCYCYGKFNECVQRLRCSRASCFYLPEGKQQAPKHTLRYHGLPFFFWVWVLWLLEKWQVRLITEWSELFILFPIFTSFLDFIGCSNFAMIFPDFVLTIHVFLAQSSTRTLKCLSFDCWVYWAQFRKHMCSDMTASCAHFLS